MQQEALTGRRETLHPKHHDIASGLFEVASVLMELGRFAEAESLLNETLEIYGDNDPPLQPSHSLGIHSSLAVAKQKQGQLAGCEEVLLHVLKTHERVGPEYPATLGAMRRLARLYLTLGRLTEARDYAERCLLISRRVYGVSHIGTLRITQCLSEILIELGELVEAEKLLMTLVETRKDVLGPEHHYSLVSMHHLAVVFRKMSRDAEAEAIQRNVIAVGLVELGEDHPLLLSAKHELEVLSGEQDP